MYVGCLAFDQSHSLLGGGIVWPILEEQLDGFWWDVILWGLYLSYRADLLLLLSIL